MDLVLTVSMILKLLKSKISSLKSYVLSLVSHLVQLN